MQVDYEFQITDPTDQRAACATPVQFICFGPSTADRLSTFDDAPRNLYMFTRCLNSIVRLMQREKAAHRSLVAAAGFFDADPLDSPVTNAPRRGQQHLSDSLCLLRQLGRGAEAEAHYNAAVQQGKIPWRNSLQRPGEMLEALFGVPYPTDPVAVGGGGAYIYIDLFLLNATP